MTRFFGAVLLAAIVCLIAVALLGRAMDVEAQERVIFTRAGVTMDCERHLGPHGSVSYYNCELVP